MKKKEKQNKKNKKSFSIPLGIIIVVVIIICVIIGIIISKNRNTSSTQNLYQTTNNIFSNSELKSVEENTNYKNKKKIKLKDLSIGDIQCGMSKEEMIDVLGECRTVYDGYGEDYDNLNYECYRYDDYNILIDLDKESQIIKRINYFGDGFSTDRDIKIDSTVADVISAYHSEKNMGKYENNEGTYIVLYNSDDVFDYLYNDNKEDKSLGYMYQYGDKTYTIEYNEDGMQLTFNFLNDQVSHISMSY